MLMAIFLVKIIVTYVSAADPHAISPNWKCEAERTWYAIFVGDLSNSSQSII